MIRSASLMPLRNEPPERRAKRCQLRQRWGTSCAKGFQECLCQWPEGNVIARLHRPSGEYDLTLGPRHRRRLADETGFADPSLAED